MACRAQEPALGLQIDTQRGLVFRTFRFDAFGRPGAWLVF